MKDYFQIGIEKRLISFNEDRTVIDQSELTRRFKQTHEAL